MKRYLLFDAKCIQCSSFARSIAEESNGWLEIRSLSDPEMQTFLAQAQQKELWKPALLEVENDTVHVYTGAMLRLKLWQGLGFQRAWHIAESLHLQNSASKQKAQGRRQLFKRAGIVVGGLAVAMGLEHLQASPSSAKSRTGREGLVIVPLEGSKDTDVAALEASPIVRSASQHFGTPNWAQSKKGWLKTDPTKVIYQIEYKPSAGASHVKRAFLLLVTAPGKESQGLVCQIVKEHEKHLVMNVFTSDGHLFGTLSKQNGKVTSTRTAAMTPYGFTSCFMSCIGEDISGDCLDLCEICAVAAGPEDPACEMCVACAGGDAMWCIAWCAF